MRRLWPMLALAVPLLADVETGARDVLTRRCLGCHSGASPMGKLDLTSRSLDSRTLARLADRAEKGQMPPGSPLPAEEQEALRAWRAAGTPWREPLVLRRAGPDWWAFQPLRKETRQASLDGWVREKLHAAGLKMSPPADRRTLIRRVTFDLTGLPPAPEEIEAFVRDERNDAYERLVDRLLASPHYGERWARHWLDVVRYSESEGFERDWLRDHAWSYRDYVIRAFNADKPYPQFVREQIAGDVLEPATHEGLAATGLLVLGPIDAVGLTSAVAAERTLTREDQLEEMLGVVSQTFLGLTVNCARCHDHKFDPIPQRDYYRLKAVFESVHQPTFGAELKADGRYLLTPAEASARDAQVQAAQARVAAAEERVARSYRANRDDRPVQAPFARWTFDTDLRDEIGALHARMPVNGELVDGRLRSANGKDTVNVATPAIGADLAEKTLEAWLYVAKKPQKTVSLLQVRNRAGFRGAAFDSIRYRGSKWDNGCTVDFRWQDVGGAREELREGDRVQVAMTFAANGEIRLYRNGVPYGQPYTPDASLPHGRLQTYVKGDAIVEFAVTPELELDEARIYAGAMAPADVAASFAAGIRSATPAALRAAMTKDESTRHGEYEKELESAQAELKAIPAPPKVFAAVMKETGPTHLLVRGDVNRPGDVMAPGAVSCLKGHPGDLALAPDAPHGERRRKLAEWIADERNPLLARVMVNRLWHHHFGAGLVESPNDFGYNGGQPSHPELLDWLAREFAASGWSLKQLHKRMVMSETYRQSSAFVAEAAKQDAGSRLLWRYAPRRLEAEAVRDAMLTASGTLNPQLYGPSFRPFEIVKNAGSYHFYQPADSDTPEWQRRTLYRMNVTSGGNPMLDALDCPAPAVKTPKRSSTTTALQALSLMNNAFVQRQARSMAARLQRDGGDAVERAFRLTLGRAPSASERQSSLALVERQGLEALCWGLFNTSEFLYVE